MKKTLVHAYLGTVDSGFDDNDVYGLKQCCIWGEAAKVIKASSPSSSIKLVADCLMLTALYFYQNRMPNELCLETKETRAFEVQNLISNKEEKNMQDMSNVIYCHLTVVVSTKIELQYDFINNSTSPIKITEKALLHDIHRGDLHLTKSSGESFPCTFGTAEVTKKEVAAFVTNSIMYNLHDVCMLPNPPTPGTYNLAFNNIFSIEKCNDSQSKKICEPSFFTHLHCETEFIIGGENHRAILENNDL